MKAQEFRVGKKKKLAELQAQNDDLKTKFELFLQILNAGVSSGCKARVQSKIENAIPNKAKPLFADFDVEQLTKAKSKAKAN